MGCKLKYKVIGFLQYFFTLTLCVPITAFAGRSIDYINDVEYLGLALLVASILSGSITATFIKTKVDEQLSNVIASKIFIGLTFGFASSVFISSYLNLDDLQMFLPAYLLAAIGTPMMIYAIGIASDKEAYAIAWEWIKKRTGFGGSK